MTPAEVAAGLLARAQTLGWSGHDPYDALLSGAGRVVSPLGSLPRFALSQAALRSPLVRFAIHPPRSVNPKGLALFLGAAVRSRSTLGDAAARGLASELVAEIEKRGSKAGDGRGWGYPFPWQSRFFWAPAGTPNAVVTATVGWQLLDYADAFKDARARSLGAAAAQALASHFSIASVGDRGAALSYTALDTTRVVNISALAGRLLIRVGDHGHPSLSALGRRLIQFTLDAQRPNGTWPYAIDRGGDWEDSFHTGYVLESLLSVRDLGLPVPDGVLTAGFAAYEGFFDADGAARLMRSSRSPLDAHAAAQGIITYSALRESGSAFPTVRREALGTSRRIYDWAMQTLWMPEKGRFAYRARGSRRDRRDFSRWVQGWMALATATLSALEQAARRTREAEVA